MSKFAFVFPGQGSQHIGMLKNLAEKMDVVVKTFNESSTALGFNTWDLASNGPEEKQNNTVYTQPLLLTAGIAIWRLWQELSQNKPAIMAGHSLGEYTALTAAGALDFADALFLVQKRANYMQEAVPVGEGAMAALLGIEEELVHELCKQASREGLVSAANINCKGQIVIAGKVDFVEKAIILAKENGAKRAIKLSVSVPSHCILMKPAADNFMNDLNSIRINKPVIPVIHNVDADVRNNPDDIRQALYEQLYKPVLWEKCVQHIAGSGFSNVFECGPGAILTGLAKKIDPQIPHLSLQDEAGLEKALSLV